MNLVSVCPACGKVAERYTDGNKVSYNGKQYLVLICVLCKKYTHYARDQVSYEQIRELPTDLRREVNQFFSKARASRG
jgi:hypothetical protein